MNMITDRPFRLYVFGAAACLMITATVIVCISMLIYSISQRKKYIHVSVVSVPFILSFPPWLLIIHYFGGCLLACHSLPFLVLDITDEALMNSQTNSTRWSEMVSCLTDISSFHLGFVLFFGVPFLVLHVLTSKKTLENGWTHHDGRHLNLRHPHVIVGSCVVFACIAYLSLWLSLYPPDLSECSDQQYSDYLFIVENIFLIFGIYLTFKEIPQSNQKNPLRLAFTLAFITGIAPKFGWIRVLVKTRPVRLLVSTIQSSLYVNIFIVLSQSGHRVFMCIGEMCPLICKNPWRLKTQKVRDSQDWPESTLHLSNQRRLTSRQDVAHLPANQDAPVTGIYY